MGCKHCSESADDTTKYQMFIGRFQPFHDGHKWLISKQLDKSPVLIAVRDIAPDERNPFTTKQTIEMIREVYKDRSVEVISIPDISGVNYGRGVGYEINEFIPPDDIKRVSATEIRNSIKSGDDSWKNIVDPSIHEMVVEYLE